MAEATSFSPLLTIPLELKHEILTQCPDPFTLRSLALSCKTFYSVFSADQDRIATVVVSGFIHPSLQRAASVAVAASKLPAKFRDLETIKRFDKEHLIQQQGSLTGTWSMADSLSLARLHDHVTYLANAIFHELVGRLPSPQAGGSVAGEPNDCQPSATELYRLQAAIYVFHMVCNVFKRHPGYWFTKGENTKAIDFWRACYLKLAQHEIEQQVCLFEYFMVLVAKCFNEIVQHDVNWGHLEVDLITSMSSMYGEHIITSGLDTLRLLAEAGNYQDIHKVLHRGETQWDGPLHTLFSDAFSRMAQTRSRGGPHEGFDPNLGPFYQDPDHGPAQAFESVRPQDVSTWDDRYRYIRNYRHRGYVFWDETRLQKHGFFDAGWETVKTLEPEAGYLDWQIPKASMSTETLEMSRKRRDEIWRKGGRGWWSFDDESKVVYLPPKYRY
ncbi:unnamed protein product [Clonostachys byssicola]|uniref:F-box domain-containing protein n=1 Tax=Clonostachys byssicola TaxID=160290 RepID=A0A9N9U0C0_9HYPO|nr:unnamed protein product [Clonostachys byssicola]